MESVIKYGGWVVSAILLVLAGYSYLGWRATYDSAVAAEAAVREEVEVAAERRAKAEEELEAVQAEAMALRKELGSLREQLAAATPTETRPMDSAPAETSPASDDEAPTEPEGDASPSPGDRAANAQMAIVANIAYQDLYQELNLPEDVRDTLNEMVAGYMARVQRSTMAGFRAKDRPAKEVHSEQEAMEADLREQLESYLTPEELEAWDAYEPVADQIMYERLVDGQLNMMAAGLTHENRVLASQVVAEELVRELDLYYASDELYTMDNFNNAQARALQASLERLGAGFETEQFALVEGYVNQALRMFETMSEQAE